MMSEDKKIETQSKWDFDRVASCSAIFIALVAMVVAVYEARVTREHQEISVWPSLIQYNSSIPKVGEKYMNFGMYIKNNGIGPAIVKKITYKHEGDDYENLSDIILKLAGKNIKNIIRADKATIKVLLPGEERLLFAANFNTDSDANKVFKTISEGRVSKEFCFCSLYKKCWRLTDMNENIEIKSCD